MVRYVKNLSLKIQAAVTITKLKSKEHTLKRRHYYNKSEEEGWFSTFFWKMKEHWYIKWKNEMFISVTRSTFSFGCQQINWLVLFNLIRQLPLQKP